MNKDLEKLNDLIEALQTLPTIGKKTAIRLATYLVKNKLNAIKLAHAIENASTHIKECNLCGNFTENEICDICLEDREKSLCLIESSKDILVLEENKIHNGYYFVLNHLDAEKINQLIQMIDTKEIKEIIFAFPPSIDNDTIVLYLEDKLKDKNLTFSKIAQGVPNGVKLENVDFISIMKAFECRTKI